jgi:uracil-DNA glycosylase family 4
MSSPPATPTRECNLCPRLVEYRHASRLAHEDWHNAPVPSFGDLTAEFLVVGLAPGIRGANRTGRPFTGDYAGHLLYASLIKYGFASGIFAEHANDGLALHNCRITNAVRCVPPGNLPTPAEIRTCNHYLAAEIEAMPHLRIILSLGLVSHQAVLRAIGDRPSRFKFVHGASHDIRPDLQLVNSYHVSRYNTSTKRLNTPMFEAVMAQIQAVIAAKL